MNQDCSECERDFREQLKEREQEIEELKKKAELWDYYCAFLNKGDVDFVTELSKDWLQLQERLAKYESAECNDPVAWPAIVENKRLRASNKEIDKLKERLEVSDDHSHDGISARDETIKLVEGKNTELMAYIAALRTVLADTHAEGVVSRLTIEEVLDSTPIVSLAENNRAVEAATICKCADKLEDGFTSALIDRSRAIMSIRDIPSQYKDNAEGGE